MVAQKLVAIESSSAKTASGAVKAPQNLARPLLVPKIKIEASGKKTSGNIMNTSMPMLKGRATSNPRTCRIVGISVLTLVMTPVSPPGYKSVPLFPLLHLVTKDLLDYLWIGLVPTAKIFNRKRHLNVAKSLVSLVE